MKNVLMMLILLTSLAFATQEEITVEFKPGASSAAFKGSVRASEAKSRGELHDSYSLRAGKGQIMTVDATADGPVSVYVWRKSLGFNQGYMLNSSGDGKLHLRFALPANDTYMVNVEKTPDGDGIDYTIKFSIR